MKINLRNIIVTSLLLFLSVASFAQEEEIVYEDTISVTEWLDGMEASKEGGYTLKNTWVRFDENGADTNLRKIADVVTFKDSTIMYVMDYSNFNFEDSTILSIGREQVYDYGTRYFPEFGSFRITNCKLSGFSTLKGLRLGFIEFLNCEFMDSEIRFDVDGFHFEDCSIGTLRFKGCKTSKLYINNCVFSSQKEGAFFVSPFSLSIIRNDIGQIRILNTKFKSINWYGKQGEFSFIEIGNQQSKRLYVENCTFQELDSLNVSQGLLYIPIICVNVDIEMLRLFNLNLYSLDLEGTTVSKSLYVDSVFVSSFVRLKNVDFPLGNTNLDWNILKGKKLSYRVSEGKNYIASYPNQITNKIQFKELLSIYQKMLNLYQERGDRQSFNACYVEMRDLQTDRLHYEYTQNKNMNTLFNWRMSQFLKTFCDFGTNPVKPLIISMWVILAFGFMYFFFYNEWDKVNRQFLIKQHRKMLQYFSSEQKLEDFYTDEYMADFKSYESYKQEIDETNLHVPFFIRVLGKPLYKMSLVRFKIMTWLYRSTEVLQGKWSDLTKGRKVFVGATVGSGILIYLVFLVAIRLLNSVVLSINTFSTLGFGDIPVKGIMKYMAILEGFLGWFLLSIFSVSLISQILPA